MRTLAWLIGAGAVALTGAARAEDTAIVWKGAPEFTAGEWRFKPRGRVFLDYVRQAVDGGAAVGERTTYNSRIRTARLGVEGSWTDRFAYVAEASIANGDAQWEDLLLEIKAGEALTLTVGNFKTLSLENLTSGRSITFMERGPFNEVLGLGRTLNVAAATRRERWSAAVMLSGDNINEADVAGRETTGVSGRVTYAPISGGSRHVHLGAWARRRDRGDDEGLRYRARPNTAYGDRFIDTGALGRADTTIAAEAAAVAGSLSLQAEYGRLHAERPGGGFDVDAGYAFVSWFPTGESRPYRPGDGEFGRVKISRPVSAGGPGAVELALRYDRADLSDAYAPPLSAPARAGEYRGVTAGATWYPIPYVRFMANYTDGRNDNPGAAFDADVQTFQLRAQFDF